MAEDHLVDDVNLLRTLHIPFAERRLGVRMDRRGDQRKPNREPLGPISLPRQA